MPQLPGKETILAQLDRITGSPEFDTSKRSGEFLRFVVTETLAGRSNEISQYALAREVFGRGENFDPGSDPIVRMHAGRVRRSLEHYYLTAGTRDPILIALPKGTYTPTFDLREPAGSNDSTTSRSSPSPSADPSIDSWPTLMVSPLRNLTGDPEVEFVCEGLASDLAVELSRNRAVHVFLSEPFAVQCESTPPVRFRLTGTVAGKGSRLKLNLRLVDGKTGRQLWADTFLCSRGVNQASCLEKAVQTTVAIVAEEQGVLSQHLDEEARQHQPSYGPAYEAILRFLHFDSTHDPATFAKALHCGQEAIKIAPENALCWSYLARLCGIHWSLGVDGDTIPIEDSIGFALRGVGLAPRDVQCRVILSYIFLIADEVDEARREAETALELNGPSAFWLDSIGYLLTLSGDWDHGPALIRQALEVNPFPRRSCYSALWLDAIRRDDTTGASDYAKKFAPTVYFWSPLMEAVTLVMSERADEAVKPVEQLLEMMPDFPENGHWLITRHVKSPNLVAKIEKALAEAGAIHES